MTDAERLRSWANDMARGSDRAVWLRHAAKDLERLAAIDEVLRECVTPEMYQHEAWPPEMDIESVNKVKQIHGRQLIDALIAQDLLPKAEVADG